MSLLDKFIGSRSDVIKKNEISGDSEKAKFIADEQKEEIRINHKDDKWTGNLDEHPLIKHALDLFQGKIISIEPKDTAFNSKELQK